MAQVKIRRLPTIGPARPATSLRVGASSVASTAPIRRAVVRTIAPIARQPAPTTVRKAAAQPFGTPRPVPSRGAAIRAIPATPATRTSPAIRATPATPSRKATAKPTVVRKVATPRKYVPTAPRGMRRA